MRTFHQIDIVKEIIQDPYVTIGQRNFALFRNYTSAFEWYTEVQYNEQVKAIVENMPSIEEYVAAQLGENDKRTVCFEYYMGWSAEDDREHFELCFDKIMEYEKVHYLDPSGYSYIVKDKPENLDLRKDLKTMFVRSPMYGINSFAGLRAYLDGYFRFKNDYQLALSEYETRLLKFIDYWKSKVSAKLPFETWDRPFRLKHMGTTDFGAYSIKWEIERFEEILNDELGMELEEAKIITM